MRGLVGPLENGLKSFIYFASISFDMPLLQSFINALPTAEVEPITASYTQSNEEGKFIHSSKYVYEGLFIDVLDMGLTYAELSVYGCLRKENKFGSYGTWPKSLHL